MEISTADVKGMLESMYPLRRELVPCFIGEPGIGKTQGIKAFAEAKGVKLVTFILSNAVPSEVSGIRMPDNDTKKLEVFDDARMSSLEDGDVLFFDEILEASPQLWSACLTLIQDRVMASGRPLPDVFIVAASNPVASAKLVPASVRDRFLFAELSFDFDCWRRWFHEEHGVLVPRNAETLFTSGSLDGSVYNILSPRKFTKLYEWMARQDSNRNRMDVCDWIDCMFGVIVRQYLIDTLNAGDNAKGKLLEIVYPTFSDDEIKRLEKMSLPSLLGFLKEQENWDEIKELLEGVEVEEVDDI